MSRTNGIASNGVKQIKEQEIIEVAAGIILRDSGKPSQQVLIAKRPDSKDQGGLWEFPGGKLENEETPEQALARELKEEIGIQIVHAELFQQIIHQYPNKQVELWFYKVLDFLGEPTGVENQEIVWIDVQQLSNLEFPEANLRIVQLLLNSEEKTSNC